MPGCVAQLIYGPGLALGAVELRVGAGRGAGELLGVEQQVSLLLQRLVFAGLHVGAGDLVYLIAEQVHPAHQLALVLLQRAPLPPRVA